MVSILHITSGPSEVLEPSHETLVALPRCGLRFRGAGFGAFHCFTFHLQVSAGVNTNCLDVNMAEDGLDNRKRVAGLKQVHRFRVSKTWGLTSLVKPELAPRAIAQYLSIKYVTPDRVNLWPARFVNNGSESLIPLRTCSIYGLSKLNVPFISGTIRVLRPLPVS